MSLELPLPEAEKFTWSDNEHESPQSQSAPLTPEQQKIEEERAFHWARFEREAEQRQDKRDWLGRKKEQNLSAMDVAHEEAIRDYEQFKLAETREYKESENQLTAVIESIKKKHDDPEGEGKKIRPLLYVMSGGLEGPYSVGQAMALQDMGYDKDFDVLVGASTGSVVAGYMAAGQVESAASNYEKMTSKEFFDSHRVREMVDVDYAVSFVKDGPDAMNTEQFYKDPRELYFQVYNDGTGQTEFVDPKKIPEGPFEAIRASAALPYIYNKKVKLRDSEYRDGGINPLPIDQIIEKFKPTDILILPNRSYSETTVHKFSEVGWAFSKILPEKGPLRLLKNLVKRRHEFQKELGGLKDIKGVNVGIMWPPLEDLSLLGQDVDKMKAAVLAAEHHTFEKFGQQPPA